MRKKVFTVLVVLSLLFVFLAPAYAYTNEYAIYKPMYVYINYLSAGLSISSSGNASCSGIIIPYGSTVTCSLVTELQQYKNGSWSTIRSWTNQAGGNQGVNSTNSYYVSSGYIYRVAVTGKIYSSTGVLLESQNKVSQAVNY